MSETATITPQDVARGLFMAAQEEGIDWQQARLPADAIRYEAAAQAALQAWALGSPDWDKGLPRQRASWPPCFWRTSCSSSCAATSRAGRGRCRPG